MGADGLPSSIAAAIAEIERRTAAATPRAPEPLSAEAFLQLKLPPRKLLLGQWLPEKGLGLIAGPRGIGKTNFALTVAYAVASGGGFLGWKAQQPRKTLYVDGEMPAVTMQERLARIASPSDRAMGPLPPEYLSLLMADLTETGIPDLSRPEGIKLMRPRFDPFDLIVLDNLSSLARSGKENEAESWSVVQEALLELRRAGKTVLLVHHTGKGGQQRGTSKKEDILDTVLLLKRPDDYEPRQGARFIVTFDKARGFSGQDADPFEASLDPHTGGWSRQPLVDKLGQDIRELSGAGLSQREIAKELGCGLATVNRHLKRQSS